MFRLFRPKLITEQIKQYCFWRSIRYPTAAWSQKKVLDDFSRFSKISCISTVEREHIEAFIDQFSSQYMRVSAIQTLRQFFRFAKRQGYVSIQLAPLTINGTLSEMVKTHHLLDLENVIRVKTLRSKVLSNGKPMSYRAIAGYLERKDKRKYDVHAIYRWANYRLPEGLELSPETV